MFFTSVVMTDVQSLKYSSLWSLLCQTLQKYFSYKHQTPSDHTSWYTPWCTLGVFVASMIILTVTVYNNHLWEWRSALIGCFMATPVKERTDGRMDRRTVFCKITGSVPNTRVAYI